MLDLEIVNCKRREPLCIDIVEWFYYRNLTDYTLEIIIEHKNLKKDEVYGYCDVSPYEENPKTPRSFLIEIEKTLKTDDYIKIILHELYHVFQFCKGDLRLRDKGRYWKGNLIENLDYEEQPHEIEANEYELKLYHEFLTFLDNA
jgi:hypothetical protein